MITKTIMSGIGGQGILFSGICLAWAAMEEGQHVTYLPSYGAEMRGGIASCTIAISNDEEIASPVSSEPDYLVIMDNQSLFRLQNRIVPGGILYLNSNMVTDRSIRSDIEVVDIPVNDIALSSVGLRYANMIMLGAFVGHTHIIKISSIIDNMADILGKGKDRFKDKNIEAIKTGNNLFSKGI
jgi:2-oxoglutarate ferredoxin oxidoreductase subunit gamma